jgi:uncharacterized protein YegL
MSALEELVEFVRNPDPRCPCLFLLDTSTTMIGTRIGALNKALLAFHQDICQDDLARRRCEIALITFGLGGVQVLQDFVTADGFHVPHLSAGGDCPMGEAICRGIELLRERKAAYKESAIAYYRPWVFLISCGEPTDTKWLEAVTLIHTEVANNKLVFFAIGVEGANMQKLAQMTTPQRPPMMLRFDGEGEKLNTLFVWLSRSQQRVSHSKLGEKVSLPPIDGWARI